MSATGILNPLIPNFIPFPLSKLSQLQFLNFPPSFPRMSFRSQIPPNSLNFSFQNQPQFPLEDEEHVIGDCIVFEEGIFDDPFAQNNESKPQNTNNKKKEIEEENLIPDEWVEVQREINITKKERRKLSQQLEFGQRAERRRLDLMPIGNNNNRSSIEEYLKAREEKLKQLKPLVLENPDYGKVKRDKNEVKSDGELSESDEEESGSESRVYSSGRVLPRDPRSAVYGGGLEDIKDFFNSGIYDANAAKSPEGPRKLFTKEEKVLLNKRFPDLVPATSAKWQPLHTLAASGEFYLLTALLKHIVDINVPDKDGLTAIHKAILGKKQAIFNFLLRESANPLIRDKDGATLMHYAVRTASTQMIKILLLYNVDINLQDHDGWTPLHLAVQSRRTDIVRLLLIKGADKNLKNRDGLTPLDICLHSGRDIRTYELIKLLKQLPKVR
ncbi:ankyrin repeat domain-containing protein, chloroplastic [Lycium ferocissimum]|uniref:ankyrin repeat domain-containing protein, chloroplastic n=1 Tax=Lycium ferocissimum TaxID=112874 RepID=UPI002814AC01|nr:ankyrin repeat domain-containing protein, chloroplastic [Lycium ferocissimum]